MSRNRRLGVPFLLLGLAGAFASTVFGGTILLGSDYLHVTGATFGGAPFTGVPLGPANTDAIVQRKADANIPVLGNSDTIPIELVALQLVSTVPVDFGLGTGSYFLTLQSARGGPASTGSMTITQNTADDHAPGTAEGTFTSFFDVFFDIRLGALNGPIALSTDLILTNQGANWDADPSALAAIVGGVIGSQVANQHSGKSATQMDFFPGTYNQTFSTGATVNVTPAVTPEPGSLFLLAGGLLAMLGIAKRKARMDRRLH